MKRFLKNGLLILKIFLMLEYKCLTYPTQDYRNLM